MSSGIIRPNPARICPSVLARVRVLDFGLAKLADVGETGKASAVGGAAGEDIASPIEGRESDKRNTLSRITNLEERRS